MITPNNKENIKSVILYGSYGRGNERSNSDVDVCLFYRTNIAITEENLRKFCPNLPQKQLTVSGYPHKAITEMVEYGSLFLWHLKLEGKILYGNKYFRSALENLKTFDRHNDEILYHNSLLKDLKKAFNRILIPNECDLSLLFTIARNTCMILSHKCGIPVFDRYECYRTVNQLFRDLPLSNLTFEYLSKWKSIYERIPDSNVNLPDIDKMRTIILELDHLLDFAHEHTK